jgi:hypothetical protein
MLDFYAGDGTPKVYNYGDPIYDDIDWESGSLALFGPWDGAHDKFIGVRIKISGEDHYGWIHLNVGNGMGSVTIRGFAYDNIPNRRVYAGLTAYNTVESAINITAVDAGNSGSGLDLLVEFDPPTNQSGIGIYRVIVVKSESVDGFNLETALQLGPDRYEVVVPISSRIAMNLGANLKDSDGDALRQNQFYQVFVLSLAGGNTAFLSAVSSPSNEVALSLPTGIEGANQDPQLWVSDKTVFYQDLPTGSKVYLFDLNGKVTVVHKTKNSTSSFRIGAANPGTFICQVYNADENLILNRRLLIN